MDASYSANFSSRSGDRLKHIFLALVLTGNYCKGDPSYVSPPPIGFSTSFRKYDSVVDNMQAPEIFVVFKDTSVYPLYLITYE